jgi:mitogen-activated protein kinase organizer 1
VEGDGSTDLGFIVRSTDNAKLASCGADKAVILWDVGTGSILRKFTSHWERVNAVDFNDDGSVIASGKFNMCASTVGARF